MCRLSLRRLPLRNGFRLHASTVFTHLSHVFGVWCLVFVGAWEWGYLLSVDSIRAEGDEGQRTSETDTTPARQKHKHTHTHMPSRSDREGVVYLSEGG